MNTSLERFHFVGLLGVKCTAAPAVVSGIVRCVVVLLSPRWARSRSTSESRGLTSQRFAGGRSVGYKNVTKDRQKYTFQVRILPLVFNLVRELFECVWLASLEKRSSICGPVRYLSMMPSANRVGRLCIYHPRVHDPCLLAPSPRLHPVRLSCHHSLVHASGASLRQS